MTKAEILDHLHYHYWAVHRTLASCEPLDDEMLKRDVGGAYPSIFSMLKHMYGAEVAWLARWQGKAGAGLPSLDEVQDFTTLKRLWQEQETYLLTFSARADINLIMAARGFKHPLWQMLLHMINHSSFHRGQVMHFVRAFGHTPQPSDLIHYLREQQNAAN
jgi:uncharacterized damage-inducible protein DinB